MADARLAHVCSALGDEAAAQRHREAAQTHHAAHREQQQRIVVLLDQALAEVDPTRV
jgi:hypothetical protein